MVTQGAAVGNRFGFSFLFLSLRFRGKTRAMSDARVVRRRLRSAI